MTTTTADRPGAASAASRVAVLVALMAMAAVAGETLRPTNRLSETKTPIVLEKQVPEAFGEWRLDTSIRPLVPDPGLQAMLDTLYSQTLARTYVNAKGERVMLSIAYGSDQSNEATAVHRPEFCYSAQGFRVKVVDREVINIGGTITLMQAMEAHGVERLVFSSSATVYGEPDSVPVRHLARLGPQAAADQVRPAGADS